MTNKEKWTNELIDMCIIGGAFAVDKYGVPHRCAGYKCTECTFEKMSGSCFDERKSWLDQEYSEPVYLSQIEHTILSALNPIWKYIIRDKDGQLSLFTKAPLKVTESGLWACIHIHGTETKQMVLSDVFKPNIFSMIKWTDNKPWSIEKLLSLQVKD